MELENRVSEQINDIKKENLEKLAQLFPSIIKDGQVDFKALKEELGEFEEVKEERYEFTWAGKQNAKKKVQEDVGARTLKYIEEDSKNPDITENLYIEGDNLEVLKLLRQNYYGSIKMIYIDPPYNTDGDFIYNDSFKMTKEENDLSLGYIDEDNQKLQKNKKDGNRYHANWLNMMYPRLKVARDLLSDDGVIFISIDDNEQENLKKLCDEIFGIENYLSTFQIQVRYLEKSLAEDKVFKPVIEYIYLYSKNKKLYIPNRPEEEYTDEKFIYEIKELTKGEDFYINGQLVTLFKKGEWSLIKHENSSLNYLKETWISGSIYTKMSYGKVFQEVVEPRMQKDGLYCLYKVHGRGEDGLGYRYYTGPQKQDAQRGKMYSGVPISRLEEISQGKSIRYLPISTFYDYSADFGNISHEGGIKFNSGKKPVKLLKQLMNLVTKEKDYLVLDFFSGSASTAHAVMQFNAEDGGTRKAIMVQLNELTYDGKKEKYIDSNGEEKERYVIDKITGYPIIEKDSITRKNGFYTICEIGKERIRRAGELIKKEIEESNKQLQLGEEPKKVPDIGFKVFRTADTNINWKKIREVSKDNVMKFDDPDMLDFTLGFNDKDVVYEVLLRQRDLPLSEKLVTLTDIGSRTYLYVDSYLVCLETKVTEELIENLAELNPLPIKFIFRDSAFGSKIGLKEETFRKLKTLVEKNSGLTKKAYTVEFI